MTWSLEVHKDNKDATGFNEIKTLFHCLLVLFKIPSVAQVKRLGIVISSIVVTSKERSYLIAKTSSHLRGYDQYGPARRGL